MIRDDLNFSLWCDFVERDFLENDFKKLLEKGVGGATSNPAIFKSAFLGSDAYREQKQLLSQSSPKEIYENLAIEDIKKAAIALGEIYESSSKKDGFISIEVDPNFCDDAKATIEEGVRLYEKIGESNVMIKIPATNAGFEAMENLMERGINVNATLVFSPHQAQKILDAFENGLNKFKNNKDNQQTFEPQGVISVFVSRFDRKLDPILLERNIKKGIIGIINATKIYYLIEERKLSNVKTLFASTGVKGDEFVRDYYIKNLLFRNTINTAPLDALSFFLDNGTKTEPLIYSKEHVELFFETLKNQNIEIEKAYEELMDEGLEAFKVAFKEIMDSLE